MNIALPIQKGAMTMTRICIVLFSLGLVLGTIGCRLTDNDPTDPNQPKIYFNLPLYTFDDLVPYIPDGSEIGYDPSANVTYIIPSEDCVLGIYPVQADSLVFFTEDEYLYSFVLSDTLDAFPLPLPPGSELFYQYRREYDDTTDSYRTLVQGIYIYPPETFTIHGYALDPDVSLYMSHVKNAVALYSDMNYTVRDVPCEAKTFTWLYYSSMDFKAVTLTEDSIIHGITLTGSERIFFYENGSLWSGTVKEAATVFGYSLPAHTTFSFSEDGRLMYLSTPGEVTINGLVYTGSIEFYNDGQVGEGRLAYPQAIDNVEYTGYIYFYEDGSISKGTLQDVQVVQGYSVVAMIYFYENGSIKGMTLVEPATIQGVSYIDSIKIFETGKVESGKLSKEQSIAKVSYVDDIWYYENGGVRRGTLSKSQAVNGMVLSGSVQYFEDGSLLSGTLDEPAVFHGVSYIGKISLWTNPRKVNIGTLSESQTINGIMCKGGIIFKNDGNFQILTLASNQTVQNMELTADSKLTYSYYHDTIRTIKLGADQSFDGWNLYKDSTIEFSESYAVPTDYTDYTITLAQDTSIQNMWFKSDTRVTISEGQVVSGRLAEDTLIQNMWCAEDYFVKFYSNGQVAVLLLSQPFTIGSLDFPENTTLTFYQSGALQSCLVSENRNWQDVTCSFVRSMDFYENGQLEQCMLASLEEVQDITLSQYSMVSFWDNGQLKSATLNGNQIIQDIPMLTQTQVHWNEDGSLLRFSVSEEITIHDVVCPANSTVVLDSNGYVSNIFN